MVLVLHGKAFKRRDFELVFGNLGDFYSGRWGVYRRVSWTLLYELVMLE